MQLTQNVTIERVEITPIPPIVIPMKDFFGKKINSSRIIFF